jgi:hypothetical protein
LFNHSQFHQTLFNHELFNHKLFNHELFNHELFNRRCLITCCKRSDVYVLWVAALAATSRQAENQGFSPCPAIMLDISVIHVMSSTYAANRFARNAPMNVL